MFLKVRNIFVFHIIHSILLFLPLIPLFPQNYTVKTFTTKDGLPNNNIRAIAEDSTGFLWFGTWDGLSRYDGYEFKNYYHVPGDTNSIPYFSILNLCVDKSNNLWIRSGNSELVLYDRVNDNFKKIIDFEKNSPRVIYNMSVDKYGNLWVRGKNGLLKRDFDSGKFSQFEIFDNYGKSFSLDSLNISNIDFSGNNKIWLIGSKIYELEVTTFGNVSNKLILKNIYTIESSFLNDIFDFDYYPRFSVYESPSGNSWLLSNIGLFKLNKNENVFVEYLGKIEKNEFTGKRSFIWSTVNGGLFTYDPFINATRFVKPMESQLVDEVITNEKGVIWFSNTSRQGASLGLKQIVFTNSFFRNYLIEKDGNELPAVFSIVKDEKNNIWAGVRGKDYIVQFTPDNKIKKTGKLSYELFKLSGHVRSLIKTKDGIWIGYITDLLMFYDFKSGHFKRHFADEWSFRTLAVAKEGNLFIGTENLSLYYPESGKTSVLWNSNDNLIIYKLFLDDRGILWAGKNLTLLLKYNTVTKESITYSISADNYHIEDICPGENNDLWLATLGAGLCNFDPVSGKTVYYTTSTGLSNNTTYSILKDKSGNLWISTNEGISRLNPQTGIIRVFNESDGLGISEFNSDASYVADDGEFFFGGMGGFVGFYPDSLSELDNDFDKPRILLTDFKVSGEEKVLSKPLNNSDTIILSKGENNFQLSFSSTDFINSGKTLFRYRLDGINISWIETDSRNRNANYSNLKPGRYSLKIQATNRNGEWIANKNIVFRLMPHFYQTRLFLISVPFFIVLLITGIIIMYIRQLKQREKQKQDNLRLQSLRGQMNPHFIFNSLNSINYFISNNDKISANRYIADFSRLIRSILSNLGNDYVLFENELNSIRDYLTIEHLRFGDKFDFELKTDGIPDCSNLEIFPGLVQPFIENAIWHGIRALENRKGIIRIKFSSTRTDCIKCTVEDDGIGRQASINKQNNSEKRISKGISIVSERLQIISKIRRINYNLVITDLHPDRLETGTRVEIDIPVKYLTHS